MWQAPQAPSFLYGSAEREFAFVFAGQLGRWARSQGVRLRTIHRESSESGFDAALSNYSDALWGAVNRSTGDALAQKLNAAVDYVRAEIIACKAASLKARDLHDIEMARLDFLWRRYLVLQGFTRGFAGKPEWHHFAAQISAACDPCDELFARQAVRGRKKPKPGQGGKQLTVAVLCWWLPAGLWRAGTRSEQLEILQALHPLDAFHTATDKAIAVAQRRLGLLWQPRN